MERVVETRFTRRHRCNSRSRRPFSRICRPSASRVSASPTIMSVAVSSSTSALGPLTQTRAFAINYLSSDAIWNRFSQKSSPRGADRFQRLEYAKGWSGVPIFPQAVCVFECHMREEVVEIDGSQVIFGYVLATRQREDAVPLVYLNGEVFPQKTTPVF